jgi:hypothetical protein
MLIKQCITRHHVVGANAQGFVIKAKPKGTIHRFQLEQIAGTESGFSWGLYNYRGAVGIVSDLVNPATESSSWSLGGDSIGEYAVGRLENVPTRFFKLLGGTVGASAADDSDVGEDGWLAVPRAFENLDGTGPSSAKPYLYLVINTVHGAPADFISSLTLSGIDFS